MANQVEDPSRFSAPALIGAASLGAAVLLFADNYLLFHTFAELFAVSVGFAIFGVAWHTRKIASNDYLTFVGMASLPVAVVTLLHALAYKGMPMFATHDIDLPTQMWLVARVLQASAFMIGAWFLVRRLRRPEMVLGAYSVAALVLGWAAFNQLLPVALIEGTGLTPYKIFVEYAVIGMTLIAAGELWYLRDQVDPPVRNLLWCSMAATVAAELAFTLYIDPYGILNRVGHAFHVGAFVALYLALVRASLETPLTTVFKQLKSHEAQLEEAYAGEHHIAETLQDAMTLSPETCTGLDVSHRYLPAPGMGRIGGDFYDAFEAPDGSVMFVIGDVCGKGLRAAATAMKARAAIRSIGLTLHDPAEVLEAANRYLQRELQEDSFVTAACGRIDRDTGRVLISVAGHPAPVVCADSSCEWPDDWSTPPLGIMDRLDARTHEFRLARGGTLLLVTDGVLEARADGEFFGLERLEMAVRSHTLSPSSVIIDAVLDALHAFSREGLHDDVALLAVRVEPSAG